MKNVFFAFFFSAILAVTSLTNAEEIRLGNSLNGVLLTSGDVQRSLSPAVRTFSAPQQGETTSAEIGGQCLATTGYCGGGSELLQMSQDGPYIKLTGEEWWGNDLIMSLSLGQSEEGRFFMGRSDGKPWAMYLGTGKLVADRGVDTTNLSTLTVALTPQTVAPKCAPSNEGTIYYNAKAHAPYVCNGTTWKRM